MSTKEFGHKGPLTMPEDSFKNGIHLAARHCSIGRISMQPIAHLSLLQGLKSACCGMIFNTKGFMEAAQSQCNSLEQSLLKASDGGNIPIVCDTSPCLGQLKAGLTEKGLK